VHVWPEVLLIDEVLAVGDLDFQDRCYAKIQEFQKRGATIFFVSHDLAAMRSVCERILWIDHHHLRADGPTEDLVTQYEAETHHAQSG
jgi:ABC-type polysaccharide/polyol phosphate transport system ATPase subunit